MEWRQCVTRFGKSCLLRDFFAARIAHYCHLIAGIFFGNEAVRGQVTAQASGIAGKEIAASLQTMIASAVWDNQNVVMKIFGILTLIFGATTLFFEMQRSLNTMWDVEAAPKKAWRKYILDRANSFGMILIISFLLLTSLVLSSVLGLANDWITYSMTKTKQKVIKLSCKFMQVHKV